MATADIRSMTSSSSPKASNPAAKRFHGRLKVDAQFCPTDVDDLFATVDWEVRSAQIKGENGELLFEQTNCEVPSFWSQLATNVVCSKYFYGEVGTPEREYSVRQLDPPRRPHDRRLGPRRRLLRQRRTTASASIASWPGSACISTARSIRPSGSTSACITSTASRARSATGAGTPRRDDVEQPENPYEYPQGSACFIQQRRRQHGRHHGARPQRGHALQVRLRHRHRPLDAPLAPREARRRRQALAARSRSCGSTTRSRRS